ncbi:hypothetical protein C7B67_06405 [filamentous cyanobacterium Phorm 6]|nr:hypothetical protein C7B67_06405 [filamentous cyanobacterium Phorm 6]
MFKILMAVILILVLVFGGIETINFLTDIFSSIYSYNLVLYYSFCGVFAYMTYKSLINSLKKTCKIEYFHKIYEEDYKATSNEIFSEIKRCLIFQLQKILIVFVVVLIDTFLNLLIYISFLIPITILSVLISRLDVILIQEYIFIITAFLLATTKGGLFDFFQKQKTTTESEQEVKTNCQKMREGIIILDALTKLIDIPVI